MVFNLSQLCAVGLRAEALLKRPFYKALLVASLLMYIPLHTHTQDPLHQIIALSDDATSALAGNKTDLYIYTLLSNSIINIFSSST